MMYIIVSTRTVCTMAWISGFSISGRLEPTQKLRLDRSCGFGNGFQAVHKPSRAVGPAYCSRFAVNRAAATLVMVVHLPGSFPGIGGGEGSSVDKVN